MRDWTPILQSKARPYTLVRVVALRVDLEA
jgi:hypothetical protein